MTDWLSIVAPCIAAIAGLWLGLKTQRNSLIDQLQEERDKRVLEIDKLGGRVDLLYADKHFSRLYIATLIEWGNNGGGPPIPPAPDGYTF